MLFALCLPHPSMPLRLFIAIDTPPEIKAQIERIVANLTEVGAGVRWEPARKLHATLKFLGSTREELVIPIVESLTAVCRSREPFLVQYAGLGSFPDRQRPRVIWVGMNDPSGLLKEFHRATEDAMASLGFEREHRVFTPHLTVGRVKGEKRIKLLLDMMETIMFETKPVMIRELLLVRSDLSRTGSVYKTLKTLSIGSSPAG